MRKNQMSCNKEMDFLRILILRRNKQFSTSWKEVPQTIDFIFGHAGSCPRMIDKTQKNEQEFLPVHFSHSIAL